MENKLTFFWLFLLTGLALVFLSANSILTKAALVTQSIDAYSFTFYRIISGAITLWALLFLKQKKLSLSKDKNWISAFMLFLYAITFSYAYINLEAGLGTLLLFGIVQLSMIIIAVYQKEKLNSQKLIGILTAFSGLIYLLFPNEELNLSLFHCLLMIIAGIAWAVYTILGKKSKDALFNTYDNFAKATIFIVIFYFIFIDETVISSYGILLAVISGSITSAIGYYIWYQVLPQIQIITASIIQLIVPIIAIFLSVLFLNEQLTFTLILSTVIILSGIIIATVQKKRSLSN